uniref:Chromosome segregation protein SMC n=1 Tax=Ascaris lumbricoides TaxID=6252 RepID=A0A0M3IDC0_ASCLU
LGDLIASCVTNRISEHSSSIKSSSLPRLGDLIASCVTNRISEHSSSIKSSSLPRSTSDYRLDGIGLDSVTYNGRKTPDAHLAMNGDTARQLPLQLKDPHVSQLIGVFERKILILKNRELELEQLIAKKDDSLRQSERLRALYSNQSNDAEISNLRQLLSDYEKQIDESNAVIKTMGLEKKENEKAYESVKKTVDEKQTEIDSLVEQLAKVNQEKNALIGENNYEREFSTLMKSRYDDLKSKFDQTSLTLIEKDQECSRLGKDISKLKGDLSAKDADIKNLAEQLRKSEEANAETAKEHQADMKRFQEKLDDREAEIERLSRELAKIKFVFEKEFLVSVAMDFHYSLPLVSGLSVRL